MLCQLRDDETSVANVNREQVQIENKGKKWKSWGDTLAE